MSQGWKFPILSWFRYSFRLAQIRDTILLVLQTYFVQQSCQASATSISFNRPISYLLRLWPAVLKSLNFNDRVKNKKIVVPANGWHLNISSNFFPLSFLSAVQLRCWAVKRFRLRSFLPIETWHPVERRWTGQTDTFQPFFIAFWCWWLRMHEGSVPRDATAFKRKKPVLVAKFPSNRDLARSARAVRQPLVIALIRKGWREEE